MKPHFGQRYCRAEQRKYLTSTKCSQEHLFQNHDDCNRQIEPWVSSQTYSEWEHGHNWKTLSATWLIKSNWTIYLIKKRFHHSQHMWSNMNKLKQGSDVKNLPAMWETGFDPCVRKIPWSRNWQPTPVFLSGEFHGQRSLASCSPLGPKELDTTERLTHTQSVGFWLVYFKCEQSLVCWLSLKS